MEHIKNKKILIVDDEKDICELIDFELKSLDATTFVAYNGEDALKIFNENPIDLVITDLNMPKMNGIELITEIKKTSPLLPVLLFLCAESNLSAQDAYHHGVHQIHSKPFDFDNFVEVINQNLMPKEQKWNRKYERFNANFNINIKFDSHSDAINIHSLSIGQGGFSLKLAPYNGIMINQKIEFEIISGVKDIPSISGIGEIRWIRKDSINAVGVEFITINEEYISNLINYIRLKRMVYYIPKIKES